MPAGGGRGAVRPRWPALGIRQKLVLLALAIVVVASFGFTLLHLSLSRGWIEEDLQERAVTFAREVAATIGDRRELESTALLQDQIQRILAARQNVHQLDIFAFRDDGATVIATSHAATRLPFSRRDADQVRKGRVLSRLITLRDSRAWEVMAPIVLEGSVAGAVAAKFSLDRADALAARIGRWAVVLTAVSVAVVAALTSLAVHVVVTRPLGEFMEAVRRVQAGERATPVRIAPGDEFGVLATHYNAMMERLNTFSEELQGRVAQATAELQARYRDVERLNTELFTMQRTLGHAERLALAGRIMAEVAHEVGTPIHSIAGHVELLRTDLQRRAAPEAVERRLAVIETQLGRVTEIIARLLDVTRPARAEAEPVDVNRLVGETVELLRPGLTTAGLRLEVVTDPTAPRVPADRTQLQQVLLNLLTNAIDATGAGGRVTARTRALAGELEIEVTDSGHGIPPEAQQQIFEPFFTTKPAGRGTGLGLFVAAQIVREHHGRIEVASEPGRGATFRVVLPAVEAAVT
jgi:signal transduction histidine kinase